jgi:hypothetical protein
VLVVQALGFAAAIMLHVASAIFPYFEHTVVLEVLVSPQGYLLQIPGY